MEFTQDPSLVDTCYKLVESVPEFKSQFDESVKFNHEVNSYLIFGDLTHYFCNLIIRERDKSLTIIQNIAVFIEDHVEDPNEHVSTLIHFGFLENLSNAKENYQLVQSFLRAKSLKALKEIDRWWGVTPPIKS